MLKRKILFVPIIFLLISCRPAGVFVFFSDPYSWVYLQEKGLSTGELTKLVEAGGYTLKLVIPENPEQAEKVLRETLKNHQPAITVITSLFPINLDLFAADFPASIFIQLESHGSSPKLQSPDNASANLIGHSFDRLPAFYQAGYAAARLLANPLLSEKHNTSRPGRVGILAAELTRGGREEIRAFKEGFLKLADHSQLLTIEIPSMNDRVKAKEYIDNLRNQGVVIYLLKSYILNLFYLDYLINKSGLAIVEDWQAAGSYSEAVLFSIEDNYQQALKTILANDFSDMLKTETELIWGEALKIPESLKKELQFVR
jgi:basic membrane lipoprotein Med (substrate-binding protein (PBP1-ABC) superfamily)